MAKNRIYDWVIKHFGEDIVFMKHDVCSKLQGITKKEVNGVESLTVKHSAGVHALDDKDVVRVEETNDYLFRIKHTGDWDILVTEAYCKKKEAEGVLAQDIVGEILESIAEPAPKPDAIKAHTVVDKFGVERETLYIDTDNEVINKYLADMKNIPLGMVYTLNTISEVNHNHAVYDGVVEYVESNDKPHVVLSVINPCPSPLIMVIDEKDKAVVGQTPWKNDDVPVCYIMSNTCRGIIFPYLVYSFEQMEALVQNYDRCAAMFREDVDTKGLGNKYDEGVEKSVMDMLEEKYQFSNGAFFRDKIEKKDEIEISEEEEDDICEEHLFREMAEYIRENEISSITFTLDEDGTVHCETLLRAVYPAKN